MNDAAAPTNPTLAKALRILAGLAAEDGDAGADWTDALVSELSPILPPPVRSDALIGAYTTGPGLRWHADQLISLCRTKALAPAERARRRYHARLLRHGLAPDRAEFRPLVTVLLPVYNRAGLLVEAVQSCIDQSWRPIEILVVDDGSTDDVPAALRRFGDQVRLIRKGNGGDASARNFGLAAAQGDFIHFLDSDDLLAPDAVANAVAAFTAVADADLCHGQGQWIDMRSTPPQTKPLHFREHANPIRALIVEFAFTVPTVMMPHWRMLAMPPFEEDLRRSSDWRYWQRLGFANIKVVGIRSLAAHLRRFEHSLQATPHPEDDSHALAMLRGLRDLLQHPHTWPYAAEYANLFTSPRIQRWFEKAPSARLAPMLGEIAATLQAGSATNNPHGLSMLPVLAALNGRIDRMRQRRHWPDDDPASAYRALAALVTQAIGGAAPISDRDIAFWTAEPALPLRYRALHRFFAAIQRRCAPASLGIISDTLLRKLGNVPQRRIVRLAARMQPILGARLAALAAAAWRRRKGA
ncbi:MAG: hypothetical protein C0484_14840 [Rhodospirillum sp.]|nr:hypothetical protein [Rhodospirillum sp.]